MKKTLVYKILAIVVVTLLLMGYQLHNIELENKKDDADIAFFILSGISDELYYLIRDYEEGVLTKELLNRSYAHIQNYKGIIARNSLFSEFNIKQGVVYHPFSFDEVDNYRIDKYKDLYNFIHNNLESLRDKNGDTSDNIRSMLMNEEFMTEFIELIKVANE